MDFKWCRGTRRGSWRAGCQVRLLRLRCHQRLAFLVCRRLLHRCIAGAMVRDRPSVSAAGLAKTPSALRKSPQHISWLEPPARTRRREADDAAVPRVVRLLAVPSAARTPLFSSRRRGAESGLLPSRNHSISRFAGSEHPPTVYHRRQAACPKACSTAPNSTSSTVRGAGLPTFPQRSAPPPPRGRLTYLPARMPDAYLRPGGVSQLERS